MSKVIAPFLFLAIAAGLFFSYTKPAYQALQSLVAQEERLDDIFNKSTALQETRDALWGQYIGFKDVDMKRLKKLLPDSIDPVRFIIDVDDIAIKHNVKITAFTVPNLSPVPISTRARARDTVVSQVSEATFSIKCEGLYEDIKQLLSDMETSLALMDVSQLQVSAPDGKNEEEPDLQNFSVSFSTHWLN